MAHICVAFLSVEKLWLTCLCDIYSVEENYGTRVCVAYLSVEENYGTPVCVAFLIVEDN